MSGVDPIAGLVGGVMIGLASTLLLANLGRLAGVSGALHELFGSVQGELRWRACFLGGLFLSGVLCASHASSTPAGAIGRLALGGLLVGIGTRMASGCTSGHGVCGLGRRSKRSFVAVITFVGTAMLATFVMRHVVGVSS
ncbi:MAG TPA: YeeE/YedE family protein [Nannocystaceae bacterium]|nr:YeeE/YedE family protein [Nannocystaceae bacterium]